MRLNGVHDLMNRGRGMRIGVLLALVAGLGLDQNALASEPRLSLYASTSVPVARFGLDQASLAPAPDLQTEQGAGEERDTPPSPLWAGFLSALVPGSGQLIQGDRRGWLYLGIEAAGWFSYLALHSSAAQAEEDYEQFADVNWSWARYDTTGNCGPGLGPSEDFEEEKEALEDAYENSRDQFYQDIGEEDVYACGWGTQSERADYLSMIDDADGLYNAASYVIGAIVLNHVVSAIDAAKSASNKRKAAMQSFHWDVSPVSKGTPGLTVELRRSF